MGEPRSQCLRRYTFDSSLSPLLTPPPLLWPPPPHRDHPVFLNIGSPKAEQLANRNLKTILSDPQQLNSYSYAEDNPVTIKDPSGLITTNVAAVLGLYAQVISLLSQIVVALGGGGTSNPVSASTAMLAHKGHFSWRNRGYAQNLMER
jgi:hypothetical protein